METMPLAVEDIASVTEAVWDSVLDLDLVRAPAPAKKPWPGPRASVAVDGALSAVVVVQFQDALAEICAGRLFAKKKPTRADARIAMGELAARVAGNVKSLVPGASRLSLAVVSEGDDSQLYVPGTHPAAALEFRCRGHRLAVAVLRQDE